MRQFLANSDPAFRDLERRAKEACVRFRNQELPPGSSPTHADVGFEVQAATGRSSILVTSGVQYTGQSDAAREWFRAGVREFPSFDVLRAWLAGPLTDAFAGASEAGQLTDLDVVNRGLSALHRPLYLDESAVYGKLAAKVRGQDDALKSLAAVTSRHCARLRPSRPAVVFAVGPSGVGKTRSAEVLAQVLRELDDANHGYQYLRLDMNEYQEAHRVSQLIGAPQGYVGHGEGSQLLDALRANPRTIVLFDEIEKAHPAILRVLMNAMDAGRLSMSARSSEGREVDCRSAIFIFTSNLDAKSILDELETRHGFGDRSMEDDVCRRRLHAAGVAPEIVGRIGRFLVYRPLSQETKAEIVTLAVAEVGEEYGLKVSFVAPAVIVELLKRTRSETFGVRPERYLIDDQLGSAFARAAREGNREPIEVSGPPYQCRTLEPSGGVPVAQPG